MKHEPDRTVVKDVLERDTRESLAIASRFPPRARLGRYEILCAIGIGGMGEVYRALDTRLGRVVALKVLSKALTADEHRRALFEAEARAVSAISHRHICTLFDIESDNGLPFLVMEYLSGETLEQRIRRGALPIDDCLRHATQLTEAVIAVHRAGIVHRDLKPANVMLTAAGVKLLDFGIAALTPSADELATAAGFDEILGTVPYMAPEQLRGEPPASAADLYAIGAILFEMLTGSRPFAHISVEALIAAILGTPPPLVRKVRQDVPPSLDRVIRKLLAKQPAARHASAAHLLSDLRRIRSPDARTGPRIAAARHQATVSSVAVLPFVSVTGGKEADVLADGLVEVLIAALARLGSLRVISRASVARLDRECPLQDIAARLRVDGVIEGSVGLTGERIRVTARLIHAASDTHLWSETFEQPLQDILSVQADLAEAIARGIQVSLTAEERATVRGDHLHGIDAHLLYLKARFHWNHPTPGSLTESRLLFEQALDADPAYAPAYAGLADWYHRAWLERMVSPGEARASARRFAMQALALDRRCADAHASLALSAQFDWDFRAAQAGFQTALALCPSYAAGHLWYGTLKMNLLDYGSALAEIGLARACDPLSPVVLTCSGTIHLCAGQYADALADLRHALELQEDYVPAHYQIGLALLETGAYEQACEAFTRAYRLRPGHPTVVAGLAVGRARSGDVAGARALEHRVQELAAAQASPLSLAELYVGLGDHDRALEALEQAYQVRQAELIGIAADPLLRPLRHRREFRVLLRRIGLRGSGRRSRFFNTHAGSETDSLKEI